MFLLHFRGNHFVNCKITYKIRKYISKMVVSLSKVLITSIFLTFLIAFSFIIQLRLYWYRYIS